IFLSFLLGVGALLLVARDRAVTIRSLLAPLAAAAFLASAVGAAYARPYLRVHARTGDRPVQEVDEFSARPASYLAATPNNWLYGGTRARSGGPERRLFPGTIALLLALPGLLLVTTERRTIVYLLLLVVAFEASLGLAGYSFSALYYQVPVF